MFVSKWGVVEGLRLNLWACKSYKSVFGQDEKREWWYLFLFDWREKHKAINRQSQGGYSWNSMSATAHAFCQFCHGLIVRDKMLRIRFVKALEYLKRGLDCRLCGLHDSTEGRLAGPPWLWVWLVLCFEFF
jgi:hypothetical protein